MKLSKILFWRKDNWVEEATFEYTIPKGSWHIQEQVQSKPDGSTHHLVVLTPTSNPKLIGEDNE